MKKYALLMAALLTGCSTTIKEPTASTTHSTIGTTASWLAQGSNAVQNMAAQRQNKRRAKNVILFVGDGMGISTLTAGRIFEGQLAGQTGEENLLSFEHFPYTALVKTYNVNAQVSDSAGTASALNTGTKTRIGVINTAPTHPQGVCKGMNIDAPMPLAHYAEKIGMSTGIVSTAALTHATPAAVYARSPSRGWESDVRLTDEAKENGCTDIASQITADMGGNGLEVALGGGLANFLPTGNASGVRMDNKDITTEWTEGRSNARFVKTSEELASVDYAKTDHLLGLFSDSHMAFDAKRPAEQPSLAAMTEAAIKMLSKNKNGYYLMVEAGRIDHGHHGGSAFGALTETAALSEAVRKALELVDIKDTLILVTADHSHTLTMSGYPRRGNPILGLSVGPGKEDGDFTMAEDGKPYTTLGYQNGPGAISGERKTLTQEEVLSPTFLQQAAYALRSETHGGEDVALFAIGPWAHLVHGTIEQNVIFHIMDHALKLRKRAAKK